MGIVQIYSIVLTLYLCFSVVCTYLVLEIYNGRESRKQRKYCFLSKTC